MARKPEPKKPWEPTTSWYLQGNSLFQGLNLIGATKWISQPSTVWIPAAPSSPLLARERCSADTPRIRARKREEAPNATVRHKRATLETRKHQPHRFFVLFAFFCKMGGFGDCCLFSDFPFLLKKWVGLVTCFKQNG